MALCLALPFETAGTMEGGSCTMRCQVLQRTSGKKLWSKTRGALVVINTLSLQLEDFVSLTVMRM